MVSKLVKQLNVLSHVNVICRLRKKSFHRDLVRRFERHVPSKKSATFATAETAVMKLEIFIGKV